MGSAQLFNTFIDLPKSAYFLTRRVTFWQALLTAMSILLLSVDTAVEDIILQISRSIARRVEDIGIRLMGVLYPKWGYAW